MRRNKRTIAFSIAALSTLMGIHIATASPTKKFTIEESKDFLEGELKFSSVSSQGIVQPSVSFQRVSLSDDTVAYSMVRGKSGRVFVGTGNNGKIYTFNGNSPRVYADTKELIVTALARNSKGELFAGSISSGVVYRVDSAGKLGVYATLKGVKSIWSLVYDEKKNALYAGTGPDGKVFAIRSGKVSVLYDSKASHVLSLGLHKTGLLAGLSDGAALLRIKGPRNAEIVYDFPNDEITAIDVQAGNIVVAINKFTSKISAKGKANSTKKAAPARKGKGQLWRIDTSGRVERILVSNSSYFACVQFAKNGEVFAGSGADGRIYRVQEDGSSSIWVDVDERQILALDIDNPAPVFLSSDVAALYRVKPGTPSVSTWTSDVLDAKFPSRWGHLHWRAKGKILFQTRSGNREEPDGTWSKWSAPFNKPGSIRSSGARFLQLRADLSKSKNAELLAVEAYYLPQNQRAKVKSVSISKKNPKKADPNYRIAWKVENVDDDSLRFRLYFRREKQKRWRSVLNETEELTKKQYDWNTESVPDGYYVIKVQVSDEIANPKDRTLTGFLVSKPVVVDNHPPTLKVVARKGGVEGVASDAIGPIANLEYAIDGGKWKPFSPSDGIFDTKQEQFKLSIKGLRAEALIAIRATDTNAHTSTQELVIRP